MITVLVVENHQGLECLMWLNNYGGIYLKEEVKIGNYDTKLICSDWRYSASVVGLSLYFDFHEIDYKIEDDYILYRYEDIKKDKYLEFVEYYFIDNMHHKKLEKWLMEDAIENEDDIKRFNDTLVKNTTLKKVFGKEKYTIEKILSFKSKIEENRYEIIEGTYKNGRRLYYKFANTGSFFEEARHCCRLVGYYFDGGKKSKNVGYGFDKNTFLYEDCLEFDFIPFAFSKTDEGIFINNNYTVKQLLETHRKLNIEEKPRRAIFENIQDSSTFIEYDAEVIIRDISADYYETLYIRREAINILKSITKYEYFANKFLKLSDNTYLNIEREVTNSILNLNKLDDIIVTLLKRDYVKSVIQTLIEINNKIYHGGESMEKQTYIAKLKAGEVNKCLEQNKVSSFKNKLLSALAIEDYDNFNVILLKLSNYSGVEMSFAYDLFDDFEKHKNVAFSFVNELAIKSTKENREKGE